MRAAFLAPILPRVMKEGESKKGALILMKNSHFDRTLRVATVEQPLFLLQDFKLFLHFVESTLFSRKVIRWNENK